MCAQQVQKKQENNKKNFPTLWTKQLIDSLSACGKKYLHVILMLVKSHFSKENSNIVAICA